MPGKEADLPVSVQVRLGFADSSIFGRISSVCSVPDHRRMVLSCASSAHGLIVCIFSAWSYISCASSAHGLIVCIFSGEHSVFISHTFFCHSINNEIVSFFSFRCMFISSKLLSTC